jgi:hypothetical protein
VSLQTCLYAAHSLKPVGIVSVEVEIELYYRNAPSTLRSSTPLLILSMNIRAIPFMRRFCTHASRSCGRSCASSL